MHTIASVYKNPRYTSYITLGANKVKVSEFMEGKFVGQMSAKV